MITIANADARHIPLPDQSVQCVVTSPPYWGLRDYGISNQIGLEPTPAAYVANIVAVMRECWRVLKDDGVLWLNLGDSYAGSGKGWGGGSISERGNQNEHMGGNSKEKRAGVNGGIVPDGLKPKDLCGIPWRVAFALQTDGWYLRQDIIWHKPNPMPESVTDRCTKSHEYVFLLTKQARYYYDNDAIRESTIPDPRDAMWGKTEVTSRHDHAHDLEMGMMQTRTQAEGFVRMSNPLGRNRRSVWTVATSPYSGAHFATFPPALIEPMILAGSRLGDIVLDVFAGSGTTGQVAVKHGRRAVLFDLNTKYIDLQFDRTSGVQITMPV